MASPYRTIVRPIVTEKSSAAFQDRGEYTFEVHPDANKLAIRQAIETLFGVHVTGVRTLNSPRKEAGAGVSGRGRSAVRSGGKKSDRHPERG